jgi:hypothetical protein
MEPLNAERMINQIGHLQIAMDKLGQTITAQGIGVSEKIDHASQRYSDTVEKASATAERHAKSLTGATWALVVATLILAGVAGVHAYVSVAHGG